MRTAVSELAVERPRALGDALAILAGGAASGAPLTPLAGGTDLLVAMNAGTLADSRFLDVWPLRTAAALGSLATTTRGLRIGALATFTEIARSPLTARWPMLRAAAREVGGWQIQNRATIGGNIANASPAGDSLPVLLAAGARIELKAASGVREVPFEDFYTGYRTTVRRPDELITAVLLPRPPAGGVQFFRKVGTRRAQAISKVVTAALVAIGAGARVETLRIGIGSVADRPIRARAAEAALLGRRLTSEAIDGAAQALTSDIRPIDDIRSTERYRRDVAARTLRQFLELARLRS